MGQRSQIYLRFNGKLVFASYYQWNYGERMVSRARWGIEWLKNYSEDGKYDWLFSNKPYVEKMRRVFDVNFDMHDVQISQDIVKEWQEHFHDDPFNDVAFNWQDNNDGQLFVDIVDGKTYYAFTNYSLDRTIMDAEAYMEWDAPGWQTSEYLDDKDRAAIRANFKAISEMATLMTHEQLNDFLTRDYAPKPQF